MKFNKAFWNWFGDSKVVDYNGDPLVVYHGTREKFSKFKRTDDADLGFHFGSIEQAESRLERTAKHYRGKPGHIVPVYLSIQNPLKTKDAIDWGNAYAVWKVVDKATKGALGEFDFTNLDETAGENGLMLIESDLRGLGYDGIVYKNSVEGDGVSYIAFQPSQIKSAAGNDGSWDADDPDIRSNPSMLRKFYHVTDKSNLRSIRKTGLRGGYGDWGFGVYLWDDPYWAKDFAASHGWDGELKNPVIIEVETDSAIRGRVDPSWEDTEVYEHTWYVPLKEDEFVEVKGI